MKTLNVGLVGCGMIRTPYLNACGNTKWLKLTACADLIEERAKSACEEAIENGWGNPTPLSFDQMLEDDDIDLIMNITNPSAHYPLNKRALEAGKHVHSEKPLCVTLDEGRDLLETAEKVDKRLTCAPDTFLGAGHQTARYLIDSGAIGKPTAATFFFAGGGPDGFHQDPEFFFQPGAGPLFDIGVYSLTQMVSLIGPIRNVAGHTKITFSERTILSDKKYGQKMKVEVPTHVSASLEFENGVLGTFVTSFDIKGGHNLPHGEIYGTKGTLSLPDPNGFGGNPKINGPDIEEAWKEVELSHGYSGSNRGIGAADLAASMQNNRRPRASAQLAYHVLDAALAMYKSAEKGQTVQVNSTVELPKPFETGLLDDIED